MQQRALLQLVTDCCEVASMSDEGMRSSLFPLKKLLPGRVEEHDGTLFALAVESVKAIRMRTVREGAKNVRGIVASFMLAIFSA